MKGQIDYEKRGHDKKAESTISRRRPRFRLAVLARLLIAGLLNSSRQK